MKRKLAIVWLLIFGMAALFAEKYEKIKTYQIGPGTIYTQYREYSHPWDIFVTEVDLTNPYIQLETVKAGDAILGRDGTSSMSAKCDSAGHRVVSAINGDFYNTSNGQPINNQVLNGECVQARTYGRSGFGYSEGGVPSIFIPDFNSYVVFKDSSGHDISHALSSVNMDRWADHLVLYNHYKGSSTQTNQWGTECVVSPINDWIVNDTVYGIVEMVEIGYGDDQKNMIIPDGKVVLSGNGTGDTFLRNYCQTGDTVKIYQGFSNTPKHMLQYIGGGPWMLKNGVDVTAENTEGIGSDFYAVRHPRTCVGYSGDSTKAFFMVVDGRTEESIGMTCHEQAAFLKSIGAMHAINLDGGGSSTFTVRSNVMNTTSDGWERWVANALMCVSSAPDSDLSIVQIERDSVAVYKNNSFEIPMSGWDMYYNPKEITDWSAVSISYPGALGSFTEGNFTVSEADMDGEFIAELGTSADTLRVHIIQIDSLDIYPDVLVSDTQRVIPFHVAGSEDGDRSAEMDMSIFDLQVLDASVGSIDAAGIFTPLHTGETAVVISYGDKTDTSYVRVEKGVGEVSFREMESLDDWALEGENLTDASVISLMDRHAGSGGSCFKIQYTTDGSGEIHLKDLNASPMYGIPSEILLDVKSDGLKHKLYIVCEDALGIEYKYKMPGYLDFADEFRTVSVGTETPIPTTGNEYYPMTVKYILFDLKSGDQSGEICVDRLRFVYPGWTSIEDHDVTDLPSEFSLEQNYPNPFNPVTAISYRVGETSDVDISIYDVSGALVAALYRGQQTPGAYTLNFDASHLPAGIYCYRLSANSFSETRKMLLLK